MGFACRLRKRPVSCSRANGELVLPALRRHLCDAAQDVARTLRKHDDGAGRSLYSGRAPASAHARVDRHDRGQQNNHRPNPGRDSQNHRTVECADGENEEATAAQLPDVARVAQPRWSSYGNHRGRHSSPALDGRFLDRVRSCRPPLRCHCTFVRSFMRLGNDDELFQGEPQPPTACGEGRRPRGRRPIQNWRRPGLS